VVFKIGQKVVYPSQGVAVIEQIEAREINGEQQEFYLLRLHANNSLVMVPTRNAEEVGLRRPLARSKCDELLDVLAADFHTPPKDWKDRFKEFTEAMRSGDLFVVGETLKTLTYLNQIKPLSFREKQMMERARNLIVSELAMVCRKAEAVIAPKVDEALQKACAQHTVAAAAANH
jgi:CarD family transcriptional regulator